MTAQPPAVAAPLEWLDRELERAVGRMGTAVAAAPPDATVPACPGWDVSALVGHVVRVHRWAAAIVLTGGRQREPEAARRADLARWYAGAAAALLAALRAVGPEEPAWNFTGADETARFWWRRQLHEVTIHAVDAVLAGRGRPTVDPQVAADGVDEVLAVWPRRLAHRGGPPVVTAPLQVVSTDTGDTWLLEPGDPFATVRRNVSGGAAGGAAGGATGGLSGPASALYLRLWNRAGEDALQVDGDVARAWLAGPRVP